MSQHYDELEQWIARFREGRLTAGDAARLNDLLEADPIARQLWTSALLMQIHLESELAAPDASAGDQWAVVTDCSDAADSQVGKPLAPAATNDDKRPSKSPVLGFLGGVMDYVSHSRTLMFWLIGGSLVLYFAVQLGSLLVGRFWAQNAPQVADLRGAGTEERGDDVVNPAGLGTAPGANVVARLTNAIDCRWQFSRRGGRNRSDQPDSVALDVGTDFPAGQKLNLTAGLAELTFDSGAKVILHAPAKFTVREALGGDLQAGRLTAKVPHSANERGAAGFTINTPSGKVVDLGTEFGVRVSDDRTMHVVVFVGEVVVNSGSGTGGSGGAGEPIHVKAGEAILVGPGQPLKPIAATDERFIRDLAPLGDKADAETAYVEFVKKLKPAVWFRMEDKETDRVIRDEMGGRDGKLLWDGPGNPFVRGRIGKALWLRGTKLGDHVYVPNYPTAEHGKLTVSAWAYADTHHKDSTIAANWRENSAAGQFQFALYSNFTPDTADLGVAITGDDGRAVWVTEGQTHPFPLYEWQHVAFTTDGSTLRLYRQGREVASLKHSGIRYPSPIASLGIGVTFDSSDKRPSGAPSCWDGKLDELMIFNDTLSAEDIRKLAASAPR